jgi:hypothetical protein
VRTPDFRSFGKSGGVAPGVGQVSWVLKRSVLLSSGVHRALRNFYPVSHGMAGNFIPASARVFDPDSSLVRMAVENKGLQVVQSGANEC